MNSIVIANQENAVIKSVESEETNGKITFTVTTATGKFIKEVYIFNYNA
ncbi:MAG: hypothetical protein IKU25_02090 [Clostridia bacterium]|nr:hypothetical protein [Clostridia bacterium]